MMSEFNSEWFKSIKHKLHWNASLLDKPNPQQQLQQQLQQQQGQPKQ